MGELLFRRREGVKKGGREKEEKEVMEKWGRGWAEDSFSEGAEFHSASVHGVSSLCGQAARSEETIQILLESE